MTSTVRQVAYRLKSDGKAEVIRDAREVGDAIRASYGQAEAGANAASAAADRQEQRYRKLAQAARDAAQADAAQARYNAAIGVDRAPAASARESAAVFAAQADAMEEAERRARALRAILDPLGAAQDRLNDELAEYDRLAKAGAIDSAQLAQAQRLARQRFDETALAIDRQSRGLSRLAIASRLNLARQGADVAVTAAMGMNPAMIAIQQGPQIIDALATSGLRARGAMVLLGGALGLAAGAAIAAGAAWHGAERDALALERAATGLGRTAGLTARELEALAQAGAAQAGVSIRAARDQAAAYISTGKIGGEVLGDLIALSKDYAAFMGMDAKEATESLAKAMSEPDKAARDMTRSFGLLDQKTLDHIDSLVKLGKRQEAQIILMQALDKAVEGHAEKLGTIESAWDAIARSAANAWDWMGRALYTTQEERLEGLDAAISRERGKIFGGSDRLIASLQAERDALAQEMSDDQRRREAESAEAARNQAAQEARDRRERAARGRGDRSAEREARERLARERREEDRRTEIELEVARSRQDVDRIRALNDEIALRTRIRQLVDDGVSIEETRRRAQAEQAQLLEARALVIERETGALFRANAIEVDRLLGLERYVHESEKAADLHERINAYVDAGQGYYAAWLKALQDIRIIDEARAEAAERIVRAAERERELALARLAGREADVRRLDRESRIDARAGEIQGRARDAGSPLNWDEAQAQAIREINEEISAELEGVRRAWVHDFVSDIRRSGLGDAVAEQLERATDRMLTRLIDQLMEIDWAKMFNDGGSGASGFGSFLSSVASAILGPSGGGVGANAQGTDYWRGGLTWVGERGKELIDLPRGSRVIEHNRSMQLAVASASAAPVVSLGGLTIKNYGSEPVTGRLTQTAGGGLELELEPLFKGMLGRAGKDGTLAKAMGASPRPRRR